jgi:hypothetical protein
MANTIQFRQQDNKLSILYAQQESIIAEINATCFTRTLTQSHIKSAQVHKKVKYLRGAVRGATWRAGGQSPPQGGWKRRHAGIPEVSFHQDGVAE